MATIKCAISGLTFQASYLPIVLKPEDGYFHPVFALPYKKLYGLFSKYCKGELNHTDSYLLFLAFLHSTEQIQWRHPASCKPSDRATLQLVDSTLTQLIRVIEATNCITLPSFQQPSFSVRKENSLLDEVPHWITAWEDNIISFKRGYSSRKLQDSLTKLENKLTYYIKSGIDPEKYSFAVANWANAVAEFPETKAEAYMKLIRSCFNSKRMFATPLIEIKEVINYCECNIEAGSIHFHALMQTLKEGVARHVDYLGLSPANSLGFTLLPSDSTKNDAEIAALVATATDSVPKRTDYPSELEFTKAKLRYRLAALDVRDKAVKNATLESL